MSGIITFKKYTKELVRERFFVKNNINYNKYYFSRLSVPSRVPASDPDPASAAIECGVISGGNEQQPLIYSGQNYNRGEWPWLVAIYKRKDGSLHFICSGTLVSARHVVTGENTLLIYMCYSPVAGDLALTSSKID